MLLVHHVELFDPVRDLAPVAVDHQDLLQVANRTDRVLILHEVVGDGLVELHHTLRIVGLGIYRDQRLLELDVVRARSEQVL